jgi:DNA-binding beta-propeller fold protein YncE
VAGAPDPIAGSLVSPKGKGAVEVLISPNDQFAFVTLQGSAELAVFNLRAALARGFPTADFIGYVPLGNQPVGMASDGTWLYVTNLGGTISVINVRTSETSPASAVTATAPAGCGPARALLSADRSVLWVTARQSDELLGFSTARLRTDPLHALVAKVRVGEFPLGEAFIDGGSRIVIADSNLNGLASATSNLAVVSTASALARKPALLGYVPTGLVPRELAVEPDGTVLLVPDQNSRQLQAVRIAGLP